MLLPADAFSQTMIPAEKLQSLPASYHWVFADSLLLQSISRMQPVKRGASGTNLNKLVKFFTKIKLLNFLLFFAGAFELTKLMFRQTPNSIFKSGFPQLSSGHEIPSFFFAGFGAGPEEKLFSDYCTEMNSPVARINQTQVESLGLWQRVGTKLAVASLYHSIITIRQAIAALPTELLPWKLDFFTYAGMRLGYYSYMYAWFKQLKANAPHVAEVCFLAADTAAFAAVDAGLTTRYLQHGLNRHSMILPKFDHVDALTHDEMEHFGKRLPNATIRLVRPDLPQIVPRQPPCLLVASVYSNHDELRRILPFLEFADQLGLAIHVRPHPCEDRTFWNSSGTHLKISFEDSDASFDAALDRLRPSMVVSWYSTALVDALYRGIISVSVCARDNPDIQDMIYPLFSHCLQWPDEQDVVKKVVLDPIIYASTLSRLGARTE